MPGSFYMFPYLEPYVSHGGTVCFLLGDIRIPAGKHKKSFGINFSSSKSFKLKGAGRIAFSYEKAMKKGYRSDIPFPYSSMYDFIVRIPFSVSDSLETSLSARVRAVQRFP